MSPAKHLKDVFVSEIKKRSKIVWLRDSIHVNIPLLSASDANINNKCLLGFLLTTLTSTDTNNMHF